MILLLDSDWGRLREAESAPERHACSGEVGRRVLVFSGHILLSGECSPPHRELQCVLGGAVWKRTVRNILCVHLLNANSEHPNNTRNHEPLCVYNTKENHVIPGES